MRILVISNNYPSQQHPHKGIFVYNLIQKFIENGNEVTVIACEKRRLLNHVTYSNLEEEKATVYRPLYWSVSNVNLGIFNTYTIGRLGQVAAVRSTVKENKLEFDVIYAHFISNALIACESLNTLNKPVFVAVGEFRNISATKSYYSHKHFGALIKTLKGFIAVSPQVRAKLIEIGAEKERITVEPNGVDLNLFRSLEKSKIRQKYNLPLDKHIVLFVGRFIENKGPLRVLEALKSLPNNIVGVFVGSGPQVPHGEKVVLCSPFKHHEVLEIMQAADLFVLPTLHEGSSNVIVEAMASGLAIVSSKIPEIEFQCNSDVARLVDPMNISHISKAILDIISNNEKKKKMELNALATAKKYDLSERSKRILFFIESNLLRTYEKR